VRGRTREKECDRKPGWYEVGSCVCARVTAWHGSRNMAQQEV
jgi:hypothetical protein